MNEICRNLKDDKNKEIKNMTAGKKGNFEKIKRAYNKNDFVAVNILDDIAKFVTENPDTNWKTHEKKLSDYNALMIELRKIMRSNLDKTVIEAMMKDITGESDDKESKPDGAVYAALCDEKKVSEYIEFFPYFRLVHKICDLAMTVKKKENFVKKVKSNEARLQKL